MHVQNKSSRYAFAITVLLVSVIVARIGVTYLRRPLFGSNFGFLEFGVLPQWRVAPLPAGEHCIMFVDDRQNIAAVVCVPQADSMLEFRKEGTRVSVVVNGIVRLSVSQNNDRLYLSRNVGSQAIFVLPSGEALKLRDHSANPPAEIAAEIREMESTLPVAPERASNGNGELLH